MKRILFVANATSIHTARWVDYFVECGYDVHLATFGSGNVTRCKNVHRLSERGTNRRGGNIHYLLAVRRLSALIDTLRPDAVNAHYSYSMGLIAALAVGLSAKRPAFSVVCHGSDVLAPPNRKLFRYINRFVLGRADTCYAVSDQVGDVLGGELGVDASKIFVGQYGIELAQTQPQTDRSVDIVSIRAWHPNSRIEWLLEGIASFDRLSSVFVLPGASAEVLASLRERYTEISFHAAMPPQELKTLLRRSRIYVSATRSDGTSLSLLEAMDAGCVPVVSNIIANRSWVLDGINGFLFSSKDAFVEQLGRALELDEVARRELFEINRSVLGEKAEYRTQMYKIASLMFRKTVKGKL